MCRIGITQCNHSPRVFFRLRCRQYRAYALQTHDAVSSFCTFLQCRSNENATLAMNGNLIFFLQEYIILSRNPSQNQQCMNGHFFVLPLVLNICYTSVATKNLPWGILEPQKNHIGPFCILLVYFSHRQ